MVKLNLIKQEEELKQEFGKRYLELMKRCGKETDKDRQEANALHEELKKLEEQMSEHQNRINHTKKILDLNKRIERLTFERDGYIKLIQPKEVTQ